jgi:hypothetical protein
MTTATYYRNKAEYYARAKASMQTWKDVVAEGSKARAWRARWEAEFRHTRWIETRHGLVPAPGWEIKR